MGPFSPEERVEIWNRLASGQSVRSIALGLGGYPSLVRQLVIRSGGALPLLLRSRGSRVLSLAEREEISRGLLIGLSCRVIAAQLNRAPSTISCEVKHNGSARSYRAYLAE